MAEPAPDPLCQGLAEGREDAFAALYDRFGAVLFRVAATMLGNRADAEDAVQEVFVGLVRARQSLAAVVDLKAYLFAVLRRIAVRHVERRKRLTMTNSFDMNYVAASQPPTLEIEQAARLERALQSLPQTQREVIAMKIDGNLTFGEIASVLSVNANTAASRYRYALEKLRAAMKE